MWNKIEDDESLSKRRTNVFFSILNDKSNIMYLINFQKL